MYQHHCLLTLLALCLEFLPRYGPAHKILVLSHDIRKSLLQKVMLMSSTWSRGLGASLSLLLHSLATVNSEISRVFYFRETLQMRSFVKIKSSRNGETTLSFVNRAKACPSGAFSTSQICLLTLFTKKKFSRKFPHFHYLRSKGSGKTMHIRWVI